MHGLILAAGKGTRLQALGSCKPLVQVTSNHLIEISMKQLVSAGVDHIVIVTGHHAEDLERYIHAVADKTGVSIEIVRLQDWSRPNGYSVIAGAAVIPDDYLLVMSDHIFSSKILEGLANCQTKETGVTLAIDRGVDSPRIDPDDATWVKTVYGERIDMIGKWLKSYDAVDCGAFWATPELAPAIERAIKMGKPGSLSDGIQVLADSGRANVLDISGDWWIDIDTPADHALAEIQAPLHISSLAKARTGSSLSSSSKADMR